jgi:hypothetical protein
MVARASFWARRLRANRLSAIVRGGGELRAHVAGYRARSFSRSGDGTVQFGRESRIRSQFGFFSESCFLTPDSSCVRASRLASMSLPARSCSAALTLQLSQLQL